MKTLIESNSCDQIKKSWLSKFSNGLGSQRKSVNSVSKIVSERVEEDFLYLMVYILSEEHQADDLQGGKALKFCPFDVEV